MNAHTWSAAAALAFVAEGSLSTDYSKERGVRVESEVEMRLETSSSFERGGEMQEMTSAVEQKRKTAHVDRWLEHEGGALTKVRRHFETLDHEASMTFGDQERSDDRKGSLVDVTLELTRDGDEIKIDAVEGDAPGEALEGHRLELALDALLPGEDVETGAEWHPDGDAVKRALGLDLSNVLFPPPAPEEPSGGEGGRGRGRSRGPSMTTMMFQHAEWECTATLKDGDEEHEGAACAVIELKITASGSIPETEGGPGGGRAFGEFAGARVENSFEIELEGKLLFDRARKLPVHLELEGELSAESHTERTWGENTVKVDAETSGELTFEISLSEAKSE